MEDMAVERRSKEVALKDKLRTKAWRKRGMSLKGNLRVGRTVEFGFGVEGRRV